MSKFKQAITTQETKEPEYASMECAAYGCGLKGTLSAGTDGKSRFYCRFHFNLKPSQNDDVTFKIHQNKKLMRVFDACTTPERFFRGTDKVSFFKVAEEEISKRLHEMGLYELYVQGNLSKTRRLVMQELDERMKSLESDSMPMPHDMDVGNHYLDKFR
jgi:hypothetical protein